MIRVEHLVKRYGRFEALAGVELHVQRGEILALLGPNGAGKSTLLKSIVGLLHPSAGRVLVDGLDMARQRQAALARVGFVPQRVGFPGHLRVREVLAFYARLKQLDDGAPVRAMERVGLLRWSERRAGELSGGTLQRLGLAQAILANPRLLVLDEPTVGLDPQVSAEFRELLQALNAEGVTVVLTSHMLGEVERLAHRVAIIKEGRLVADDNVAHLLVASGLPAVLWLQPARDPELARHVLADAGVTAVRSGSALGFPSEPAAVARALEALRREQLAVESLWTTTPSLEEVFRWVIDREASK
jgi:ABC-type multidrug transport system ATPase subunit